MACVPLAEKEDLTGNVRSTNNSSKPGTFVSKCDSDDRKVGGFARQADPDPGLVADYPTFASLAEYMAKQKLRLDGRLKEDLYLGTNW